MSLAQLEALAAGLPVVATDVGGAPEIAARSDRFFLLPPDADSGVFAGVLARLASAPPPRVPALPKAFTRERMTARAQLLYRGVLVGAARQRSTRGTVWLITNNFSTGGAQSSARRFLTGLAARGHLVRAATIEESPQRPSPGRRALQNTGIGVTAIMPGPNPEALVAELLDAMTADPPHAIVFWNLITPVKVLLADALASVPIFDVSPGEMYFQSLDRFFSAVPPGLPVLDSRAYGRRLTGVVVKYANEAARAREALGAPVHIIPNGIPLQPRREGSGGKRLIIGSAARISPDKRLDQLLDAVRIADPKLPPYELRIAGGPDSQSANHFKELRRLGRGLPVKWLGHLDDPAEFLAQTDIFAMISEPAGCPNASLEAMAQGLPIIATEHGGAA
jgi:glycosyltransferase involved in cell wall biosynthesis